MPTSKQARARQQRQMEKVAVRHVERERKRRRNRVIWGVVAVVAIVTLTIGGLFVQSNTDSKVAAAPPTTEPATTTTTIFRATPTSCTALKDTLPKGAPAFPLAAGPAPTKLVTKDLTVGTGAVVTKTSKLKVDYIGVNCSGKIFDSSFKEGSAAIDADMGAAGSLIQGWLDGIPGMKVGGVRVLSIPPDLAYGATARSELIPANEPLFFLVKVNSVA